MKNSSYGLTKEEYIQFFKEILNYYEKDFPQRIVEQETSTRIPPLKILLTGNIARWAAVEASNEFTGNEEYRVRAHELLRPVVHGSQHMPRNLWGFTPYYTKEEQKKCRELYEKVPEEAKWYGRAHWCIGNAEGLPLSLACRSLNRTDSWESQEQKEKTLQVLAQIVDYQVVGESQYKWIRTAIHNIAMTHARGIFMASELIPEHPNAKKWRAWALGIFQNNFNHLSPEDASGYEADWFYSVLLAVDLLEQDQEAYHLPYHRAYFEHFKEMVTSTGSCVGYGDVGDYGNAAFLPILEKGAAIFQDGTYKYAAQQHFKIIQTLPIEKRLGFLQTNRWFDAYRWADDSVKPRLPGTSSITHKTVVVLRRNVGSNQAYLALSSQEGGNHGHRDANAIAHFSLGNSELLQDGNYHWSNAFFHNRLLWRRGKPRGAVLDYFRPKINPWHPNKDGSKIVFPHKGSTQGTEKLWHPSTRRKIKVKFIARLSQFSVVRSTLGPQERTIIMDNHGRCLVFDYLLAKTTTTAVCLYYTPEILEQGEWWVRGRGMPKNSTYDLLIASLNPRSLSAEPQERRKVIEQVLYSVRIGRFPQGTWFVTLLWPQKKEQSVIDLPEVLSEKTIMDGDSIAEVITLRYGAHLLTYLCRASADTGMLTYQPTRANNTPCPWSLTTDADLVRLRPTNKGVEITMVNGTCLEIDNQRVINLPYPGNQQTMIEKTF